MWIFENVSVKNGPKELLCLFALLSGLQLHNSSQTVSHVPYIEVAADKMTLK